MSNQEIPHEVNISDVLRLALPLATTGLAGARDARRNVQWVVVLTTWNNLQAQVKEGDLLIVPPTLQKQAAETLLFKSLPTLSQLSIAGLLLFESVSTRVAQAASEFNIPLLIAPPETSIREVHKSIASLLLDQQAATSERGMQLYRRLSEMSREGLGLAAMTDVIARLTGKVVVVQDKRLEIQAMSWPSDNQIDIEALRQALVEREQLPEILRNRKAAAKARQSHWQQILPVENMARLISPIISGDRARGYLSVVGPAGELDLLDSLAAEHGAAACALEMAKAKAVSEAKKALRGNFLEGLLVGSLPEKEIERLAGRLDHDTQQPHAVLTFAWAGSNKPSLRRLETTLNWLLSNHNRPALVHVYGGTHICVFQALKSRDDMETAHDLTRRLREQVEAEFGDARLIGGMSGPADTLADWPGAYHEALQAMQLGRRLKLNNFVVEFNSLGVYRLLGELENIEAVKAFTKQVIGPLVQYDQEHRGSLVQTIDAYFAHHGNISQTAETLFVHRNTLLYRLERIQELTKHDLNQADMRLALQLALKFWQLRPDS